MRKVLCFLCLLLFGFGMLGMAHASLYDLGSGLIYDSILDITWLEDVNYSKTSGYDNDGNMTWTEATSWADVLEYGGFDDWRLPTMPGVGWGYYNRGELGHMLYVNLDAGGGTFSDGSFVDAYGNTLTFDNFPDPGPYWFWSCSEFDSSIALPGYESAWGLKGSGITNIWPKDYLDTSGYSRTYAWVVRDGGSPSPVPVPTTILLLSTGIVGLAGFGRKRFKK
ncbi:MAG: hypothetical protein BA871_08870 [Desulfuromonadales bacterium C00003096]|nr:MAG: hypothetical protein BA871_08870 [Desulfuromonadales bacterium C00003096]